MKTAIIIAQIIISILLIIMILLQAPPESGGFSGSLIQPKFTRRGVEKLTFFATIFLLMLFLLSSLFQLLT